MDEKNLTKNNDKLIKKLMITSCSDVTTILQALSNPKRLQILTTLLETPSTFSQLIKTTQLGKTALSHHLNNLQKAGLIENKSRGNYQLHQDGYNYLTAIGDVYMSSQRRKNQAAIRRAELIQQAHNKGRNTSMNEIEVRFVNLEPMRVASFRAVSESPENDSFQKLLTWAQPKGLLNELKKHPVYGFNNPGPSPGKKEYGYEFWIKVDDDYQEDGIVTKDIPAARYAVTTCHSLKNIGRDWKRLIEWIKEKGYQMGSAQCLEKTHSIDASEDELVLDLYQAIA